MKRTDYILDLHGVKHTDVEHTLDQFFHWNNNTTHKSVEVIVGNSLEMKRLTTAWLDKNGYVYFSPYHNLGTIIVTHE
jgi:DNA-nicking Smr family endonuclease